MHFLETLDAMSILFWNVLLQPRDCLTLCKAHETSGGVCLNVTNCLRHRMKRAPAASYIYRYKSRVDLLIDLIF